MFGLMEITAQLDETTKLAIIPTVVLPFTIIGMILTSVATWIAALFGVELKAEGPKRLFEVLMKPKVLVLALLSNLVVYGAIKGTEYLSNGPYPLWWVQMQNSSPQASSRNYSEIEATELSEAHTKETSADLELLWELPLKGSIFGSPVIRGDSLFVGSDQGRVIEVDLLTGKVFRRFEIGKPVMTAPLIANNLLFAGEGIHLTHDARLYSFDLNSGAFAKAFHTQGHIERAGIITANRNLLIFPAGKDGLYAIDPNTMREQWQAKVGHIDTSPVADDERVYVGSGLEAGFEETPTKVFALDLKSGQPVWEKNIPTSMWGVPVLWEDVVCFPLGDVYKNRHYGQLSCYHKKNGDEYFSFNTQGALITQPLIIGNHLLVSDIFGKIYQFDLKNRHLEWTLQVPTKGLNYASVVVDSHDRLFMPGKEGLYIYSRTTQSPLSVWKPQEKWPGAFANVVTAKDFLILADKKGVVRALRFRQ